MRLLNATTLKLEEFVNHEQAPPYAILSHTWGDEEVTFQEIADLETARKKAGFSKIEQCCRQAVHDGWDWVWVDSCCIDKTSSAELSESINSMFRWYEDAEVCYAYLVDVPPLSSYLSDREIRQGIHFRGSRWFRRGWTLQELLAPTFLEFFDREWQPIGSREFWADEIEVATGIEVDQLANFQQCSVATKLSWAATRETKRIEDRAYSLLGLLGVNMPLIYGEGKRAFIRLQHELTRYFNDESIFAWGLPLDQGIPVVYREGTDPAAGRSHRDTLVFAPSPEEFELSRGITPWMFDKQPRLFQATNAGLSIRTEVFKVPQDHSNLQSLYLIPLNCTWSRNTQLAARGPMVLFLRDAQGPADDSTRVPELFTKVGCSPMMTWDCGQWESLGRHDILIALEGSPEVGSGNKKSEVDIRFQPYALPSAGGPVTRFDHTCYLGRIDHPTGQWDITEKRGPPPTIAENEALICTVSTRSRETWQTVGYVTIVKWNRWSPRRGLTYGIWLLDDDERDLHYYMLRLRLDSDRTHRYPITAPGLLEFGSPSAVMRLHVGARPHPTRAGEKQYCVRMSPDRYLGPVVSEDKSQHGDTVKELNIGDSLANPPTACSPDDIPGQRSLRLGEGAVADTLYKSAG
ncbi:heterokaryon incompatibility protein-domain-containing protein [Achaetomium macrosporum]|uniref:Heterokaryon incompatibility protein-domain-containing protein n=1 Tax=Achaetomium macrosporum TaxID=79813 RepID=A0AAN7H6Z2_9PEZI|nr:heterokaryon incompatibility protein-domain-containing protein [Achaetomium macrosporum]